MSVQRRRFLLAKRLVLLLLPVCVLVAFQQDWIEQPIRQLKVSGADYPETPQKIRNALQPSLTEGFFSIDLEQVHQQVLSLPWVQYASVKRQWPASLVVSVAEYKPMALWNTNQYVTLAGQCIEGPFPGEVPPTLKLLGPIGQQARVVLQYLSFQRVLRSVALEIDTVILAERGAWEIRFTNGLTLRLGRYDVDNRLKRFLAAYVTHLSSIASEIQYVDLRYTQGFAVRWKSATNPHL